MALNLDQLINGTPPKITRAPVTGEVVQVEGGVFVTPLGGDKRHPLGPCRGPADIAVGDTVLLIWTDERPWVAQVDGGS